MDLFRAQLPRLVVLAAWAACASAHADPAALAYNTATGLGADPLGRLLAERGWVPIASTSPPTAQEALEALVAAANFHPSSPMHRTSRPAEVAPAQEQGETPESAAVVSHEPPAPASQLGGRVGRLVRAAMTLMGVPYRNGGVSEQTGFDCSGFTRHVFERIGIDLPRLSRDQAQAPHMISVKRKDLQPGDLVFFNTVASAFSHVGIYLGDNKFIHAPRTGGRVRVEDLRVAYWNDRFDIGRRALGITAHEEAAVSSTVGAAVGHP